MKAAAKWKRLGVSWQDKFLLDPSDAAQGSWLQVQSKPFGVGCKACHAAGVGSRLAKYQVNTTGGLQHVNFAKHPKSKSHKSACRFLLGDSAACGQVADPAAPTADEFGALLDNIAAGQATLDSRRRKNMTWCLAEAVKAMDQETVASAEAIALYRDERAGRILIRYRAVGKDLETRAGCLGQERDGGTGSRNLVVATYRIMQRFCTRFCDPPQPCRRRSILKRDVLLRLRQRVTSLSVDSAADEVVSAELMRSKALNASLQKLTPNLRFIVRDKAHSSRRITSRPWSADPALKEILIRLCAGRGSIAKLIHNSVEVRRIFAEFAKAADSDVMTAVTNMSAAGHRFDSHATPLGRTCMHLHASIRAALRLCRLRSDDSSKYARLFLEWISEEHALQAAMLADAADSSLHFTRLLDREDIDPATLSGECEMYLSSMKALFCDGQVLSRFGFTSCVLS